MKPEAGNVTLEELKVEIVASRNDLMCAIAALENKVSLKLDELNNKVTLLEKENVELKSKVENLERVNKKNNIIVFGIPSTKEAIAEGHSLEELNNILTTNIQQSDISDIYPLGRGPNSPLKVEFISFIKKKEIFKNISKLKGTTVSISHDYTPQQREEQKKLRSYQKSIQQESQDRCVIKGNKLMIGEKTYTIADLENLQLVNKHTGNISVLSNTNTEKPNNSIGQQQPKTSSKGHITSANTQASQSLTISKAGNMGTRSRPKHTSK